MAYKLVKMVYGNPVTGELLMEMLKGENFTVPTIVPLQKIEPPVRPTIAQGSSPEAVTEWNRYDILFRAYYDAVQAAKLAYRKQFTDLALRLADEFVIVDSVTFQPSSGYTFLKAAERLMAKNTLPIKSHIYFICFRNF